MNLTEFLITQRKRRLVWKLVWLFFSFALLIGSYLLFKCLIDSIFIRSCLGALCGFTFGVTEVLIIQS